MGSAAFANHPIAAVYRPEEPPGRHHSSVSRAADPVTASNDRSLSAQRRTGRANGGQ